MNFGPVLILIQINENKKRKCPSLGEGGGLKGGLPMSGYKKGWESRGLRTNAYFISISICYRYIDT